ncbi:hypothetical protein QBC40DRAFT_210408 [Triangularia verruculosa]|uniref:Zn(2)-C6 fungal-type domain-containing protein n=1 Tax=Triangularia verruculosa TaxID=2587418 RepID=A0AAN6X8A2_9PEZI|nr:hypothetical protein QBC40DRAFT_210408 [Triangularia verruculosa]
MRHTLRRSCSACAKSKHSCDLGTPRCSRCIKRKVQCSYANEPLTGPPRGPSSITAPPLSQNTTIVPLGTRFASVDPFESYPQTRLPREHVQRLIHSFLHKIAFQYYPLDLSATSNPFLVSWWPLALGDPALFHVSLQTACLDEELLAQKGFQASTVLMADSVALLRRKVEDSTLAVQDGTMNSVITLAAIEFGKGNTRVSEMHVAGVKRLVNLRGGISAVRQTSPLTARMVSWVSLLVMGHPQFDTQDDVGIGDGIPPIPEWQLDSPIVDDKLSTLSIDLPVKNVLIRLRRVFQRTQSGAPFPNTRLHDLTCFVVHRLLSSAPNHTTDPPASPISECLRYGIVLYMFIIQGPTYFSHAVIMNTLVASFVQHLEQLESSAHRDINIWLAAVGLVASTGTPHYQWFVERAQRVVATTTTTSQPQSWVNTLACIKNVLWLERLPHRDDIFRPHWDMVFDSHHPEMPSMLPLRRLQISSSANQRLVTPRAFLSS